MRYRLRTLLIVLALGPPMLASVWFNRWQVLSAMAFVPVIVLILWLIERSADRVAAQSLEQSMRKGEALLAQGHKHPPDEPNP
jgi:hypothetical protein